MALQDLKKIVLSAEGYAGQIDEMEMRFYQDNGVTALNLYDAQRDMLADKGFTEGSLADRWNAYLRSLGHVGSLNDMLNAFWASGGPSFGVEDPEFANVVLLMHFEGADAGVVFTDDSSHSRSFTASGGAQTDTAQYAFGTSSGLFDGTGDYITDDTGADSDFAFPGDFTIEWSSRKTGDGAAGYDTLLSVDPSRGSGSGGWFIEFSNTRGLYMYQSGVIISHSFSPNDSTWHAYAITREGSDIKFFIDGVVTATSSSAASLLAGAEMIIGGAGGYDFNGHVDELRITKGVARYTANYTPAAAAFPDA